MGVWVRRFNDCPRALSTKIDELLPAPFDDDDLVSALRVSPLMLMIRSRFLKVEHVKVIPSKLKDGRQTSKE